MFNIIKSRKSIIIFCALMIIAFMTGCGINDSYQIQENQVQNEKTVEVQVEEGKSYTSRDQVAEYIHEFGVLPPNYISKSEAENMGWNRFEGNLWDVAEGKSIGGDYFGNREGLLPKDEGRKYYECDINYDGGYRGAERIVFSNDGLIFYTPDHYESFERLY